eukprot:337504_1
MAFNAPYGFAKTNTVVIEHPGGDGGKHLRVKPNDEGEADPDGGVGGFAQWEADPQDGGTKVRFKSTKSDKYLRIMGGDKVNVGGGGGKFTVFTVHRDGPTTKLESVEFPGKYIAVGKNNKVRVGTGGKWCDLKIKRKSAPFTKFYQFAKTNEVVIQHPGGDGGKFLRAKPNDLGVADPDGGRGEFARWEADPQDGGSKVRFKSIKSGKYLRIMGGDKVNIGGTGGKFTVFKVQRDGNETKLESVEFEGKFIAVGKNNKVRVGTGGQWCKLKIYRK